MDGLKETSLDGKDGIDKKNIKEKIKTKLVRKAVYSLKKCQKLSSFNLPSVLS